MTKSHPKYVAYAMAALGWLAGCAWSPALFGQPASSWMTPPTMQHNGAKVQLPFKDPTSRQSNLRLTVDTRWANNYGYRPITVGVTSPQPATSDRSVTIRIHSGWVSRLAVEQNFELPIGATSAQTIVSLPQYFSAGQFIWWEVWIDGVRDRDLSITAHEMGTRYGGNFGATTGLTFLTVSPAPGTLGLPNSTAESERSLALIGTSDEVFSLWINEFPTKWIDYSCFDVVLLTWGEMESLAQTNPAAFEGLLRWLRAGGRLWVSEAGDEFEELASISKLLGLRSSIAPSVRQRPDFANGAPMEVDLAREAWQPVRFRNGLREGQVVTFLDLNKGGSRVVRDPDEILQLQNDPNFAMTEQRFENAQEQNPGRRWPRDSSYWFVEQRLGLGAVRVFRDVSELTHFTRRNPATLQNTNVDQNGGRMPTSLGMALRSTDRWSARHGTAPDDANRDFANLLVPGVGLAPVTEFRVLITLFVLAIGPVNFWLLKRWRRLHLLVLTVPLAAVLTTAALCAYAVISDGFRTIVRAHSFTVLDTRSSEAACWTRLSYYSGLAPTSGLQMPADVAIFPINPAWADSRADFHSQLPREIVAKDAEASLARGWLRSRTPTQYLTVRSRKTPITLEIAAGNDRFRASNKLGTNIDLLLAFDKQGNLWVGESIKEDTAKLLAPIERADAIRRFRQLVTENAAEPPAALADTNSHYAMLERRSSRYTRSRYGFQQSEARMSISAANEYLADLAGLAGRPALDLPPRSFVAVTQRGPEVELGISGAREEASFHVIVGQW